MNMFSEIWNFSILGKSVILPNAEVTYKYETSSNMKTRPPENTMTSSYHVLKRTIERYDDDDVGDGEINASITKPTGNFTSQVTTVVVFLKYPDSSLKR